MRLNACKRFRPFLNICTISENYFHRYQPTQVRNVCIKQSLLDECKEPKESSPTDCEDKIPDGWSQPKVVIIGAGIAGLSAAHRLVQNGINDITVLEATDRPGGRILSCCFSNTIVELGTSVIKGGCMANSMYSLAKMGRQPTERQGSSEKVFFTSEGRIVDRTVSQKAEVLFQHVETMASSMYEKDSFLKDTDLLEFMTENISNELNNFPESDRLDILMVVNNHVRKLMERTGTNLDCMKAKNFGSLAPLPGGDVKLADGFVGILEPLIKAIPDGAIRYCKPVESISWDVCDTTKPRTSVKCDGEVFPADYVIITTPLGFLKEHADRFFEPTLPLKKMEAIQKLGFGHLNHIFFQFCHPIGSKDDTSIGFAWHPLDYNKSDSWVKGLTSLSVNDDKGCVLKGTIAGDEAIMIEALDEHQIKSDLQKHLHRFTGNYLIPKPSNVLMSKWCTNVFTRGAFTYLGLESNLGHIRDLAQPVPQPCETEVPPVLLFAGEHTCSKYYATSHGARDSGIREADTIIDYTKLLKGAPSKQSTAKTD